MKGKKGILLILVLLVLVGVLGWQFVFKKKLKKPKVETPKAAVEQAAPGLPAEGEASPKPTLPEAAPPEIPGLPPPGAPPGTPPPGLPPMTGLPGMPGQGPATAPGTVPPGTAAPGGAGGAIPKAQQVGAESQPLIGLHAGADLTLAEGTTIILAEAKAEYAGQRTLKYQWEVLSGPETKIEFKNPTALNAPVSIGDLEQPERFVLRLKATDGLTEASDELALQVFPAQLKAVAQAGGAWIGVTHLGDKWVAGRERQLEIFGPDWTPLARVPFDFPIRQFFTMVDSGGRGALYAQDPQGGWVVAQNGSAPDPKITRLPMLGNKIQHFIPIQLEGQPYAFALLEKGIELWNFSEPRAPKLRKTLPTMLQHPILLAFHGRYLYVADEQNIEIIDFSTAQALASVPSGGSITGLASYDADGKAYLVAAIGRDRTAQNRKDYGLRFFEIDSGGRLGQEKRVAMAAGPEGAPSGPVEKLLVFPGVQRALLSVPGDNGLELKIFDLAGRKLLPLHFSAPPDFVAIDQIATGKVGEQPVAVVADGNQLRVFSFQGDGGSYSAAPLKNFPGILSAAWVLSDPKGNRVWIGDEGTDSGGSLSLAQGGDLQISASLNAGGAFPVDGAVADPSGVLLYLVSHPEGLAPGGAEGRLGLFSLVGEPGPALSEFFLGVKNAEGELRPLGVAAHRGEAGTLIAVAISRVAGALGGSGIALLTQAREQADGTFLGQDLKIMQQLIPLQDARDVALSPDGKAAFLAAGAEGVIAVDLLKKIPASRMSLGKPWVADRILLSHGGSLVLASFIDPGTGNAIVKIFGVTRSFKEGKAPEAKAEATQPSDPKKETEPKKPVEEQSVQMQEYGTLLGLKAVTAQEGMRAPRLALTEDDLYLFAPLNGNQLTVFNLSNPAGPFKVTELAMTDEVRGVAVANRFKDIFVALGPAGVAKLEFDFVIPKVPETQPGGVSNK